MLLVLWSLLHAAGVTPSQSIGETALLDTLPGSNVLWDILGGVVFAGLVVLDALVRVRCVRAVAAVRLPSGWAVLSVLVAPGGWAWLDDRLEALPIMAASIAVMSLIIRAFARPSTTWRPTQRGWLAIGGLAVAGLGGLWVAMGAPLVQANGAASEVRIVPQGVYDTDRPLQFKELVFGRAEADGGNLPRHREQRRSAADPRHRASLRTCPAACSGRSTSPPAPISTAATA